MQLYVRIRNSKECRVELNFPDLSIKYNNGYSAPLRIPEGEQIPLDLLDPEDVKKSLRTGSLKGYMENGWIAEGSAKPVESNSQALPLSHFITEQMILTPDIIAPLKKLEPKPAEIKEVQEDLPKPILPEVVKVLDQPVAQAQKIQPINDLTAIKSYEEFDRLSHFLKLRWIKDSTDITLLNDILGKTPSVQFKNNITLRLTQIKV